MENILSQLLMLIKKISNSRLLCFGKRHRELLGMRVAIDYG